MPPGPQLSPACAGCLGTERCWICSGEGCHRCGASGRCHVCTGTERVLMLIPVKDAEDDQLANAS